MEAALAAAAAVRGGPLVRARAANGCPRGPRRVGGVGLAARSRRKVLVAVAALPEVPEPLPSHAQEGAVSPAPGADGDEEDELEVHEDAAAAAAETSSPGGAPAKTVRVRFVLKKQCPFGQSFHLVGDDPALGLWDPVKAAALKWTEGHEWIVEKDLPANKLVEFKFLLRDTSGKLQWQSGPNRSLQTGETVKTLIVYEDWGDVNNQKIEEEGEASIGMDDAVVSDDNESVKDDVVENELQMGDNEEVEPDQFNVPKEDEWSTFATTDSDKGESKKASIPDPPKAFLLQEHKRLGQLDEEIDKESGYTSFADGSKADKPEEENIFSEDGVPIENGLANAYDHHDFIWGWKALRQLMTSLGFKVDTS